MGKEAPTSGSTTTLATGSTTVEPTTIKENNNASTNPSTPYDTPTGSPRGSSPPRTTLQHQYDTKDGSDEDTEEHWREKQLKADRDEADEADEEMEGGD